MMEKTQYVHSEKEANFLTIIIWITLTETYSTEEMHATSKPQSQTVKAKLDKSLYIKTLHLIFLQKFAILSYDINRKLYGKGVLFVVKIQYLDMSCF